MVAVTELGALGAKLAGVPPEGTYTSAEMKAGVPLGTVPSSVPEYISNCTSLFGANVTVRLPLEVDAIGTGSNNP